MFEIIKTDTFDKWLRCLKDRLAIAKINARILRMSTGNLGDGKALKNGIFEAKIDYGPGYRLYFMRKGALVIVLLSGGDKRSQTSDIDRAVVISKEWKD